MLNKARQAGFLTSEEGLAQTKRFFSQRLRAAMAVRKETCRSLAAKLGVSGNYVHMLSSGKKLPSSSRLISICKALECSAEWLLSGEVDLVSCDRERLVHFLVEISEHGDSLSKYLAKGALEGK